MTAMAKASMTMVRRAIICDIEILTANKYHIAMELENAPENLQQGMQIRMNELSQSIEEGENELKNVVERLKSI